jgi:hypothetical protein
MPGPYDSGLGAFHPFAVFPKGREVVVIKKVCGGYQVVSSKGKNLGGPYKTLDAAKKRLRQVEFFKHRKG